ncbi:GIY-YIG nuclease family protein [Polaribacter ponticola]|uniref:GIY-YIG nuclease family protein n=1 Tax=Polaribacter ponticola TaxID=2978475 RepID=A0ABT5S9S1_9FLAO|nr:GIY-YIG nuclease family protein [Polaribacter sp. MSW5]MDD7914863.1 GIY-YIG nuclease family protein [Polaribacter sp. MSW5]
MIISKKNQVIEGYVYMLSNKNKTVLYSSATKYLKERIGLHIEGKATKFTKIYSVNELLYFEKYTNFHDAFKRENN